MPSLITMSRALIFNGRGDMAPPSSTKSKARGFGAGSGIAIATQTPCIPMHNLAVIRVMKTANILDPIHAELDSLVWDNPTADKPVLKPKHAHWIKSRIYKTLEKAGYTDIEKWLTLVFTGSLTTYQYSANSDVDISLFVDAKVFPEWSRAEMIALMVERLDGRTLPGTPFPLQNFVVGEGIKPSDLYKPGLRSGYNLDNGKWIVPPERNRVHDVRAEQGGFYAWALQMADKMERLLQYEPEQAIEFWHMIHTKRRRDMAQGKGDFSESNIIYKMLANRGLFPQISEASGEYIAKTAGEPTKPPHLRQGSPSKNCLSCKMYHKNKGGRGKCWGYGEYAVEADEVCDSWTKETRNILTPFSKTAGPSYRQVAKFVYDPTTNRLLVGRMGRPEGEHLTHNQLFEHPMWDEWRGSDPSSAMFGEVTSNGYGESFGRPRVTPGKGSLNPWQKQYQTEEAIRRAIPGVRFTNPAEMLNPAWELASDPEVTYVGEPPIIQRDDHPQPQWNFQARADSKQIANQVYRQAVGGEGSTINLQGEAPTTRYGFAPDLATQTPFPLETFSPADVEAFIERFRDRLHDPNKFIGAWIQGDEVILDVTEGHDDFDTAYQRAWNGHQKSLWDSQINDEIPVRGLDYDQTPFLQGNE